MRPYTMSKAIGAGLLGTLGQTMLVYGVAPLMLGRSMDLAAMLGHRRPPATPRRGGAFSRCAWLAKKIQYAIRFRPEPNRSNWRAQCRRSVSKLFKLQQWEA